MKKRFEVADLCRLESLDGVIVLAGKDNLHHEVEHINVMEVPDIDNWVQDNEFLMTTGYMYKNDIKQFVSLIPKLKEKNVAALGIKTKRFIDEIPEEVIECAKAYNFPLLLLPEHTTFSLVIRECMERILVSEKERKSTYLKKILTGKYKELSEALNGSVGLNLDYHKDTLFSILLVAEKEDHVMYEKEALYSKIASHFRSRGFECHHVLHHNHLVIFLSYQDPFQVKKLGSCHKGIIPYLKEYNGIMCEYAHNTSILDIKDIYEQLKKMEKVIETCSINGYWVCFNELGLYSAIPEMRDSLFYYYCQKRYINPLKAYDKSHGGQLLETLKVYYECSCNMKETAQRMYTHYNTVGHRLEKIEELLDLDLHNFRNQCTLYMSIILNDSLE